MLKRRCEIKRKGNLYKNICKFDNIKSAYKEVCQNTRNERRVFNMKQYEATNISKVYETLMNRQYKVGAYNKFIIYEPKKREIVSQNIHDKIINHLVARFILYPTLIPSLIEANVASRPKMGTSAGMKYSFNFNRKSKIQNKNNYYILKCDISKFFASIDHEVLKEKILKRIKDKEAIKIIFDIIDSNQPGLFIRLND